MNERLMQFRIGMFVIVAGLVLTMMIVWFGESPSVFRDQVYLKVHYSEAPGVVEGVPVRKSGIRVGEVFSIDFDERPNEPDGVIVTLALERRYPLHSGSVPRLNRSLIGDVTVDMLPGSGPSFLATSRTPMGAPVIEGEIAPDPSKALAAATKAFESAGDTLKSINDAASGLAKISKSTEKLDDFLVSMAGAGHDVSKVAQGAERVIKENEGQVKPLLTYLQQIALKLDGAIDQDSLKTGIDRFSAAAAKLDTELALIDPIIKDLSAPVTHKPSTDIGQAFRRINLLTADLELLTSKLRDGKGGLNTDGSLQKLLTEAELHDNLNAAAVAATQTLLQLRTVLTAVRAFVDKVSRDPSAITRGALQSR
jgi:phospholipid/cholesterol/gamma-HCH transport system substrate-binding protein